MPCIYIQRQIAARIDGSMFGGEYLQSDDGYIRSLCKEQSAFPR